MKTVRQHKAVSKYDTGWNQDSDYKHYCELREGWVFGRGRMGGCSSLFFNTLDDFKDADPMTKADYAKQEAARLVLPSFECCEYPHPWSDKKCNREKGHGGEHACIEHYNGRQNEWWKGKDDA